MPPHPLIVHFPIALLTVYALFEILQLPILTRQTWYFPVKAVLLLCGTVGGYFALLSGAEDKIGFADTPTLQLVEIHESFAQGTMILFTILALAYLIAWGRRSNLGSRLPEGLRPPWNVLTKIEQNVFRAPVLMVGALLGFGLLLIVGALGGALVYGPDIDPIVSFIYHWLYK